MGLFCTSNMDDYLWSKSTNDMKLLSFLFSFAIFSLSAQNYWQQEVNYKIDVELNDTSNTLIGAEEFEYVNNSPDTLSFLYIHLWPNAYKNGETDLAKQQYQNGKQEG